jgi:hypothetical protein
MKQTIEAGAAALARICGRPNSVTDDDRANSAAVLMAALMHNMPNLSKDDVWKAFCAVAAMTIAARTFEKFGEMEISGGVQVIAEDCLLEVLDHAVRKGEARNAEEQR